MSHSFWTRTEDLQPAELDFAWRCFSTAGLKELYRQRQQQKYIGVLRLYTDEWMNIRQPGLLRTRINTVKQAVEKLNATSAGFIYWHRGCAALLFDEVFAEDQLEEWKKIIGNTEGVDLAFRYIATTGQPSFSYALTALLHGLQKEGGNAMATMPEEQEIHFATSYSHAFLLNLVASNRKEPVHAIFNEALSLYLHNA